MRAVAEGSVRKDQRLDFPHPLFGRSKGLDDEIEDLVFDLSIRAPKKDQRRGTPGPGKQNHVIEAIALCLGDKHRICSVFSRKRIAQLLQCAAVLHRKSSASEDGKPMTFIDTVMDNSGCHAVSLQNQRLIWPVGSSPSEKFLRNHSIFSAEKTTAPVLAIQALLLQI